MSAEPWPSEAALPLKITRQIDAACDEFEASLRLGGGVAIEPYLDRVEIPGREQLVRELALLALAHLQEEGALDPIAELFTANPALSDELSRLSLNPDGASTVHMNDGQSGSKQSSGLVIRCPHCHSTIEMIVDASLVDIGCGNCGGSFSLVNTAESTRDAASFTAVDHFELIERLGMGEFGTVWKARDTILDRTVALKIPRRQQFDPVSIEKFMREARAAAQLRHPNIVSTHEVGRHADTLYIVSDYIRGVSLADMILDHRLSVRDSVAIAAKVADALEHAHRNDVVHRDLKPSNILVDDHGEPHLMDFGLAKRKQTEITVTTDGAILGTPAYMSPEQARGEASTVDGRSDIYSLGVIMFQLLTGDLPFRGTIRMLLQKVINDDPPGPRTLDGNVPKDLDTICLKCMEKDPARRYATAGELAADLRRFMAGEPVVARRIGRVGRTLRWALRNRTVALLLTATITTLLSAAVISSYFAWRATNNLCDSLLQEIRLRNEARIQGYGERVRQLVDRVRNLRSTRVDEDELRRQLVLTMGDFVAYSPHVITDVGGKVTAVRLSNDGREVFVGQNNGGLVVYDVDTGKELAKLEALAGAVISLAITERGDRLVAAVQTGTVHVWRRVDQKWEVERAFQLGSAPQVAFFSTDGARIACLKGALAEVWDVAAGAKLQSLPTKPDWSMRNGAFDLPRGRLIAGYVNEDADTVGWALWDLNTGKRHDFDMPSLGETYDNAIDVSPAGDRMAIGFDEALLVYGMTDFQQTNLSGFDATIAVAFNPTRPYLAAASIQGWITVWNPATNRQLATLHLPTPTPTPISLAFSADGGRLVAANADRIQVWDLAVADEKTVMLGHNRAITCAAFRPDGRLLATGGKDHEVRVWNPDTGGRVGSIDLGEAVQTLAFSPDGRLLAVGCMGRPNAPHLRLIDVDSKKVIHEAKPAMGDVLSLAWSEAPDGLYLAGCGAHGVALWKVSQGPPVGMETVLELERSTCVATVVNRATGLLIWAEEYNRLKAWDFAAGREAPLNAPDMNLGWHGVAPLPDGESIIYVSNKGVAEIWNAKKYRRVGSLGEPGTFVFPHIALSPNGEWFAAHTQQNTVSIWHRPTGKHVFTLRPATGAIWSLAWDPSSERLAVGQTDGGLAIWHVPRIQQKLAAFGLPWVERPAEK